MRFSPALLLALFAFLLFTTMTGCGGEEEAAVSKPPTPSLPRISNETQTPQGREIISEGWDLPPARRVSADGVTPRYQQEILSPIFVMDRIYKSMQGPMSNVAFALGTPGTAAELFWVTGYETVITGADPNEEISPEFMCHSNLDVKSAAFHGRFKTAMRLTAQRLITADQGTYSFHFPDGFGVPIMSNFPMRINAQVLNHNITGRKLEVRHRSRISYVKDSDLDRPLIPLVQRAIMGMVLVEGPDGHVDVAPGEGKEEEHGEGCSIGIDLGGGRGKSHILPDAHGRKFSAFWKVDPGREVRHTRVTTMLNLAYDTTVHAASAHLHPFAETLDLHDITANKTVVSIRADQRPDAIGLETVHAFSSREGVPLYKTHEYELISTYDNTSGEPQDAMASMFLFVHAHDISEDQLRPAPAE